MATAAISAGKGPDIRIIDNKVSIQAEAIPLSRLLHLLDMATGMNSTVPAQFANRNVNVQFSDLDVNAAVHKIFEGQMLDYVLIDGQGVMVTAASQAVVASGAPAAPAPREASPFPPANFPQEQPSFIPDPTGSQIPGQPGVIPGQGNPFGNNQAQPAVIQTPFGPIPNPRLNQQGQQGQQNQQVIPGAVPFGGAPTPFGTPFGGSAPGGPTASPAIPTTIAPITVAPLVLPNQQPATKP